MLPKNGPEVPESQQRPFYRLGRIDPAWSGADSCHEFRENIVALRDLARRYAEE